MFNVVDTFYAGLISTQALAALSLSFPVFFIIIAIGAGISQGATALIANALGAGEERKAKHLASQALSFGIWLSIALTALGIISAPSMFRLLGAEGRYLADALAYINVIFYGTIFFILNNILNSSLLARGDSKKFRNFLIVGFFLNLIFDPWFLFGGFGLPAMGIKGIAWATVIVQAGGTIYLLQQVLKTRLITKATLHDLIPDKKIFIDIAKQGFPASINMTSIAIGVFVITYFISLFGQEAVAAYGIATRIEQIALLPTIGLNMSTLSLVGQNNGAKKFDRVRETIRIAIRYGMLILTVGGILVFVFARQLMSLFSKDPKVIGVGAYYLPIASLIFWAYTIMFVSVSALQGMKRPMYGLWLGIGRQIAAPLILYALLTKLFGLHGLWWGIFAVTWCAALITLWYMRHVMKKIHII